jgi:serine/threonine protein kinase
VQQIGRYRIVEEVGRGAMGIVYKALDPAIGRTIAIKSIRLKDFTDPGERGRLRERLFREAQSAGILSHPGIVTIYDIAEADGLAYIFMEFVNGPPLEKMLEEHPPDKETLLSILRQTAAALDYAHKKGIVHRDVKPANIMIHEDGVAKVTDFGVAKIMSQQMTQAGTMMGTPSYMSPEQIQGGAITGRADQFALAVIAYEALTGEKPFSAEHLPTLLFKILRDEPLPPQRLNTTLDRLVEVVFRTALAKSPENRYECCADFVESLSAALNANPGWMPLPRGASHSLPTVASRAGLSSTMQETVAVPMPGSAPDPAPAPPPAAEPVPQPAAPTSAPEIESAPPAVQLPKAWEPRREPPPSHTFRNFAVAVLVIAAVGAGVFLGFNRDRGVGPAEAPAAEAPGPPPPAPPPDETAKAEAAGPDTQTPPPAPAVPNPPPARAPAAAPAAPEPATVLFALTSAPSNAVAVFDNNPATTCTTPCSTTLVAGRHTVSVRHEGYRTAERIIEIPRQSSTHVELPQMTGMLMLVTRPAGLTALIDGREQAGKTPLNLRLPAGKHRVTVVRGDQRQEITVDIADGGMTQQTIEWP